tara:strand:- start:79 stop:762 length:684 start_codon:yes stop_codon:yes gene_type:complete
MTKLVIPSTSITTIPVSGTEKVFPVRRIYCIGRNYADHVVEMGNDPKESPIFFQKNTNNVDTSGKFPYPSQSKDVHHELELVIALKSGGSNILEANAYSLIYGFAVGLDMTRRDLQTAAKKDGKPWEIGKAFEHSAPMGTLTKIEECGNMDNGKIALTINGVVKQEGNLNQIIWKIPRMIAHLSTFYDIDAGDIIMTGTPAGVGPVEIGDRLVGNIEKLNSLEVVVV